MSANSLVLHSPVGFVVAFGAGVVSFLSPCVLPLVPSYLSMMSGVGGAQLATATGADQRRLLRSTLLFVAGFTLVFACLAAGANTVATPLRDHRLGLSRVAGGLIVVMGLLFAGVVRPRLLAGERRLQVLPSRLGDWAAPVMGMAFAFGWTPCIGPILSAVLALAADSSTIWRGEAMLLSFSLGLGVPLVAAGVAFGRLAGVLAFARRHGRAINVGSGLVLAAFGVVLLLGDVSTLSTWVGDVLSHVGLGRLARV